MKFCEGCQHRVADDVDVCPYCGSQYRQPKGRKSRRTSRDHEKTRYASEAVTRREPYIPPSVPQNQPKKKKSKKGLLIVLFSLIAVMIGLGVVLTVMIMNHKKPKTFDYNCAEYTAEMNRITGNKLDQNKWVEYKNKEGYKYSDKNYAIDLSTDKNTQKINSITVGPSDKEDGVKMAAASMMTVEPDLKQDKAMSQLADIREGKQDRFVNEKSVVTYDDSTKKFKLEPKDDDNSVVSTKKSTAKAPTEAASTAAAKETTKPEATTQETTEEPTTEEQTTAPESIEAPEELKDFLNNFVLHYYDSNGHHYDSTTVGSSGEKNLLQSIISMPPCINNETYGLTPTQDANHNMVFDGAKVDWIAKNIFNITDEQIEQCYNDMKHEYYWREDTADGHNYVTKGLAKGSPFQRIAVKKLEKNGELYKAHIALYDIDPSNNDSEIFNSAYDATVQLKEIDGGSYWSIYSLTKTL